MSKQRITLTLFIVTSCIIFSSCSSKLTRSKAKDLIIKEYGFPKPQTENLSYGNLNYGGNATLDNCPFERSLVNKGLITFSPLYPISYAMGMSGTKCAVNLTPEGEKYKLGAGQNPADAYIPVYYIRVADMQFGEVTGIQEPTEKNAIVSYTWKYGNVTPFGETFSEEHQRNQSGIIYTDGMLYTAQVSFTKYDDGWRIDK